MTTLAIWWIRRDLRLYDNQALNAALSRAEEVLPVFIVDPALTASTMTGPGRRAFLWEGLRTLDAELRQRGSYLVVRHGEPVQALQGLVQETGATLVVAEADYSPYASRRDSQAAASLPLFLTGGVTVHPAEAVTKADGEPYTVYTPFSRAWKSLPPPRASDLIPAPPQLPTPPGIASDGVPVEPTSPATGLFPAGEAEGRRRLQAFAAAGLAPVHRYAGDRNRMDLDGTSQLSPYLRFGMVSPRHAAAAALSARSAASGPDGAQGADTWLNELIWREFYISILHHFPQVSRRAFRPELDRIPWRNDRSEFAAWCAGGTGYPVVDAAMRQLLHTGWMHNRARMIVASFLVKDLLIDWRWGERWFMQQLLDGDPAANNGGWQWTAGTGTDAAPYFRIFNPVLQGIKFDPDGVFVRRWVPELAAVPSVFIHKPWEMKAADQSSYGCLVGKDYPLPIVDHDAARTRTLAAYDRSRSGFTAP